ncbi:MAG: hypothetical protein HDT19_04485 [Oscillibacter sp.]|nr:hypothetical protein [Oscillibacter sp.]
MTLWPLIFAAAAVSVAAVLYRRGAAITRSIVAVLFVFRPGRDGDRVSLNACTGWVRHAGRFARGRTYTFTLDTALSQGGAEVLLLNGKKHPLLQLNRECPSGRARLDEKGRYCLRWEFQHATGKCELRWQED